MDWTIGQLRKGATIDGDDICGIGLMGCIYEIEAQSIGYRQTTCDPHEVFINTL